MLSVAPSDGLATLGLQGTDLTGNPLDQDGDNQLHERADDVYSARAPVAKLGPSVVVTLPPGQPTLAHKEPIRFSAIFDTPTTDFTRDDVVLGGTARATTVNVLDSGDHMTYLIEVSGMTRSGTVTVRIPASVAHDAAGNANFASTGADNSVSYAPYRPTLAGVYDPKLARFHLRNSNTQGPADDSFLFGAPGWEAISGDWDGDGKDTIGAFQREAARFYLRNSNDAGNADVSFGFGAPGSNWVLLMGDWNGDGIDTIGGYDPAASQFYLRNSNSQGNADLAFGFGAPGANWTPVVGDWDGDGVDTIGLYDPQTGMFYLRNTFSTGMADVAFAYGVANHGWLPLVGDWNGDGVETVGMFLPSASTFFLRNSNTIGNADVAFGLGYDGCQPIIGDWLGRDAVVQSTSLTDLQTPASSQQSATDAIFSQCDEGLGGLKPALSC